LFLAARHGHFEVVVKLLERGASVSPRDRSGFSPIHTATQGGHGNIVSLLLDYGAQIEEKNLVKAFRLIVT
jgi:ankyrin repeat protein